MHCNYKFRNQTPSPLKKLVWSKYLASIIWPSSTRLTCPARCVLIRDVDTLYHGGVLGKEHTHFVIEKTLSGLSNLRRVEQRLCLVHWPDIRGVVFLEECKASYNGPPLIRPPLGPNEL